MSQGKEPEKSVFQQFMEANKALLQCYRKVSYEEFKKMPEATQDNVCAVHKDKIKDILEKDQMTMTTLV